MVVGSKNLIRDINSSNVIETIINHAPISRIDIAKRTGLTKGSITSIVQNLIDMNLIKETHFVGTGVGRKSLLLEISPTGAQSVSISISDNFFNILIADLCGQKIAQTKISFKNDNFIVSNIIQCINHVNSKVTISNIIGISISLYPTSSNYIDINKIRIELERYYQTPVHMFSYSQFSALGETAYSIDAENIVFVDNTKEITMGIIYEGKIFKNKFNAGGELNNLLLYSSPTTKETLSQKCSLNNILKKYEKSNNKTSVDYLLEMLKNHEPNAELILKDFLNYMNITLLNMITLFNPEVIIINCPLTDKSDELFLRLKNSLGTKKRILYKSMLKEDAMLYGGIAFSITEALKINKFKPSKCYFKDIRLI